MAKIAGQEKKSHAHKVDKPGDMDELDYIKMICLNNAYVYEIVRNKMVEYFNVRDKQPPNIKGA